MSKDDVEKAVREAEQYAAEDAKRKEEIDTRNQGDQMVYQTERTLEELGDKVDAAEKAEVESKLNELKETLKGSDTAAIKAATEALTQVFYKLSEKMYQARTRAVTRTARATTAPRAATTASSTTTRTTPSLTTTRSKHPAPRHGQSKAGAPNKRARIWSFSAP